MTKFSRSDVLNRARDQNANLDARQATVLVLVKLVESVFESTTGASGEMSAKRGKQVSRARFSSSSSSSSSSFVFFFSARPWVCCCSGTRERGAAAAAAGMRTSVAGEGEGEGEGEGAVW